MQYPRVRAEGECVRMKTAPMSSASVSASLKCIKERENMIKRGNHLVVLLLLYKVIILDQQDFMSLL